MSCARMSSVALLSSLGSNCKNSFMRTYLLIGEVAYSQVAVSEGGTLMSSE